MGRLVLNDVYAILEKCLSGWSRETGLREGEHNNLVLYGGRTFRGLPTGAHGKRAGRGEIEMGKAKALFRFFGITDCAREWLQ